MWKIVIADVRHERGDKEGKQTNTAKSRDKFPPTTMRGGETDASSQGLRCMKETAMEGAFGPCHGSGMDQRRSRGARGAYHNERCAEQSRSMAPGQV